MANKSRKYLKLQGEKGMILLLPVDDLGPMLFDQKGGGIYVLLPNNNRVMVADETPESLLRKVSVADGFPPVVYDGDQAIEYRELLQPRATDAGAQPEKEGDTQ